MSQRITLDGWGIAGVEARPDGGHTLVLAEVQPPTNNLLFFPMSKEMVDILRENLGPKTNLVLASATDIAAVRPK